MSDGRNQEWGVIELGLDPDSLTDYSEEIGNFTITESRKSVTRPPRYGNPEEQTRAGSKAPGSVAIEFDSDESDPVGVYNLFAEAFETDSSEVYFRARWKEGDIGTDNIAKTGVMTIMEFDSGKQVGEWKSQSKTYPARNIVKHTGDS